MLESIPDDASRELDAEIEAPQFEARMFVEVSSRPEKVVTLIVAIAPPMGPKGTIWDFLGVKELCKDLAMVADCGLNFLGNQFPGLASGLPMSNLSNPANLNSSNPAIAAAAGAKADENAAPQKAAALKYLGTLGCGGC